MPVVSKAQNAAMHAAAQGNSTLGIPKSVGQDFVNASHGESVSSLPQRANSSLSAHTGISTTRRGRHAKRAKAIKAGGHAQHHALMNQAYAKGDLTGAKTHALNFANSLHAATTSATGQPVGNQPSQADDEEGGSAPIGKQNNLTNPGYTPDPPGPDSSHWISGAIKHPGALHRELGVPQGQKIPAKKIAAAEHSSNPKEAARARLAVTLKKMHH